MLGTFKNIVQKTKAFLRDAFPSKETIITSDQLDALQRCLLQADVGCDTTQWVIDTMKTAPGHLKGAFRHVLTQLLTFPEWPEIPQQPPDVLLLIGVNGSGKTTTAAKLAYHFKIKNNQQSMLAAGDTFRACGVDQLKILSKQHHLPIVAHQTGSDSASVGFDALQSAMAKQYEWVIVDTAGRLHHHEHLMEELKKIKRVLEKCKKDAVRAVWLVLDASTGQIGLQQALLFHQAMSLDGIILTKLDTHAKGGIILPIVHRLKLPIRWVTTGHNITDLEPFIASEFMDLLIAE
jgi:fused signal recognition particle receptor